MSNDLIKTIQLSNAGIVDNMKQMFGGLQIGDADILAKISNPWEIPNAAIGALIGLIRPTKIAATMSNTDLLGRTAGWNTFWMSILNFLKTQSQS